MTISYRQAGYLEAAGQSVRQQDAQLAYPMLEVAARIFRTQPERRLRHIMVTGAMRKVGTSFIARGLADSLSASATRVLIIEILPEQREPDELPRLLAAPAMASGGHPTTLQIGSTEFMALIAPGSPNFDDLCRRLEDRFDLVIWDMPPPGVATPTAIAADLMDGVVLVVETNRTSRRALAYAADRLRTNGGPMLGVVMNRVRRKVPNWLNGV